MPKADTFHFDPYRLDVANQQLWHGDEPVSLRPKTFAVLRYLVEHAGRLVTRDELIAAIWPHTCGAEKAPKRCILELRAALADSAHAPEVIGTVGRLGYRFLAPLRTDGASGARSAMDARAAMPALIGREPELARMQQWLQAAADGDRQVVLVTGEPGIGKTSLVDAFLRHLETEGPAWRRDARIGRGQCIEHYGEGEAYLPVLNALGGLAGERGDRAAVDVLRRHAPSWLAQFPALVADEEMQALQLRLQATTPRRMLREITDAIRVLTTAAPLILVLEDLQWSDASTLDLLAALARCPEPARLMLIATHRSTEIAEDHPLRSLARELLAHRRARELPLRGLTPAAVGEYIDSRFPRHGFDPRLGTWLHRCTGGNPLFLANLVDDLLVEGLLTRTATACSLDDLATWVPTNSRHLIERQMGRLDAADQRLLEAAGVSGFEFTATAVAAALEIDPEAVEERCEELVGRELFIGEQGLEEWPDGTQSRRYAFRHALYRRLWSERVPARRQQRFHQRLGDRLERAYGARVGEIAAELAVHFDRGRDFRRAVLYRSRAAQNATLRSAHPEAIDHLTRALDALGRLPDTPERTDQELTLQIALSVPLTATMGYAAPEVARTYTRALGLSQRASEAPQLVQALLGLWVFYCARAELRRAQELAARCLEHAQGVPSTAFLLDSHNAAGGTALWLGQFGAARAHLERSVALHDPARHHAYVAYDVTDPGVASLSQLSWTLWLLGYPDQAGERANAAITLAEQLSHPYSLTYALDFAAALHAFCRDRPRAQCRAEASMVLASDHGFPMWLAMGAILHGWAQPPRVGDAAAQIRQGMEAFEAIGARIGRPPFLGLLAETLADVGRADQGLQVLDAAATAIDETGERLYEAEIHRLKGELILHARQGSRSAARLPPAVRREAEGCFREAIAVASEQHAKSWELRAAVSLGRLWHRQGRAADARALVSEVYGWFTEGFETPDLLDARALLDELGAALH